MKNWAYIAVVCVLCFVSARAETAKPNVMLFLANDPSETLASR